MPTGARLFVENPFVEYDCKSNTTLGRKKRPKATLGRFFFMKEVRHLVEKNRQIDQVSYFAVLKTKVSYFSVLKQI